MKYSSLEFKGSTVGPVKGRPRDGDVSRSFMTLEEPVVLEPLVKEADADSLKTSSDVTPVIRP